MLFPLSLTYFVNTLATFYKSAAICCVCFVYLFCKAFYKSIGIATVSGCVKFRKFKIKIYACRGAYLYRKERRRKKRSCKTLQTLIDGDLIDFTGSCSGDYSVGAGSEPLQSSPELRSRIRKRKLLVTRQVWVMSRKSVSYAHTAFVEYCKHQLRRIHTACCELVEVSQSTLWFQYSCGSYAANIAATSTQLS